MVMIDGEGIELGFKRCLQREERADPNVAFELLAKEHYDVVRYLEDRTERLGRNPELLPACQVMSGFSPKKQT